MPSFSFKMTAATNVGLVRTNNEDNFIVCPDLSSGSWLVPDDPDYPIRLSDTGCLLCVADGMGGMNAGEVASGIAVDSIRRVFSSSESMKKLADGSVAEKEDFLKKAVVIADKDIKARVKEDSSTTGMGTTIVLAWVEGATAHIAWCGDSRAYLFNPKSGLTRLSKDHSYVQQLIDNGELDPEIAFYHPNSNIITRSLGDNWAKAQPDYVSRKLSTGDLLLLCSDGLCGLCQDEEILSVLNDEGDSLERCKNSLIEAALDAGGHDNVTIALLQCIEVEESELSKTVRNPIPTQHDRGWLRFFRKIKRG